MVQFNTSEGLKRFLISSQLVSASDWNDAAALFQSDRTVEHIVDELAERDLLTPLQRNRILSGDGDTLLLGDYKLLYRNGSGSFARVFRAATRDNRRTVALKLLRDRWSIDPRHVEGFHREARICQRFSHPNIVPIYDVSSDGDRHFITMEFVEGGNLRDFLRIRVNVTPQEAAQCMYDICSGLSYANSLGTTHRDLKLTNVLMSSDRTAKLVDFGLAGAETPIKSYISDDVHRALEYASLERGSNAPRNDPRSDIFFAGAILYELLCSESPWLRTRDREERKQFSRYTQIRPLHTFRPDLPHHLMDVTAKMMEVSPSSRYQTADEVLADLEASLKELGAWKERPTPVDTNDLVESSQKSLHLLIIDGNEKRRDALKQYFDRKHGFQLSFRKDPESALNQIRSRQPPGAVLFLADTTGEVVLNLFPQIQAWARSLRIPCLAVFPAEDESLIRSTITSTRYGTTMFQPATLRDIRQHFETFGDFSRRS